MSLKLKQKRFLKGWLPLGIGLLGLLSLWFCAERPAEFLILQDPPTRSDAAMVFGGDPGYERTEHAVRLYQQGLVGRLILCGGQPGGGDHATSLMEHAVEKGLPGDRALLEDRSTSTHESVKFVTSILDSNKIRSVTLVTSPYHQRRVFLAARKSLGDEVTLINSPADPSFWTPEGWWRDPWSVKVVLSEYVKLAYYFAQGWV